MAWWDNPTTPYEQQAAGSVAGQRFGQFDAGGDFDTDGIPGVGVQDYYNFVNTYLGGNAANFGQPGYEQGTQFLTTRVAPQATTSPYQMVNLDPNTRYYGNQQNAQQQAFRQNNPVTAAQVPVGQSQRLLEQQQAAAPPPTRYRPPGYSLGGTLDQPTSSTTSAQAFGRPGRLGGY